jgi:hypothetical protein
VKLLMLTTASISTEVSTKTPPSPFFSTRNSKTYSDAAISNVSRSFLSPTSICAKRKAEHDFLWRDITLTLRFPLKFLITDIIVTGNNKGKRCQHAQSSQLHVSLCSLSPTSMCSTRHEHSL